MKRRKLVALIVALVMVASAALAGCGAKTGSGKSGKADADQHLNIAMLQDAKTLDSSKSSDLYSASVLLNTEDGLVRIDNNGTNDVTEKAGAESWDVSSDGLTWTFHLRSMKWSDGKPVTAGDYVYAWKRLLNPKTAAAYAYLISDIIQGAAAYNAGKGSADAVGITAPDDKTLVVKLTHPVVYFDKILGLQCLLPLRQDIVEAQGDKYGQDVSKMVFDGPFTVSQWTKGSSITLKKNTNYWDASNVKLNTANISVILDEGARMKAFTSKQIDAVIAQGDYRTQFNQQVSAGQLGVIKGDIPATSYVFFNCQDKDKVFTNRDIRLAFSLAIDRDTYTKSIAKFGTPAYGWAPNRLSIGDQEYRKAVPEELKSVTDDPKTLLLKGMQEAGLGTDPSKITITYLSSGTTQRDQTIAQFLQNEWQTKLGVKVKLDAVADFGTFLDRVNNSQFEVSSMGWSGDYNDPMTFFDMWTSANAAPGGNNSAKWKNSDYDKLITEISNTSDEAQRLKLFQQCEQMLLVTDAAIAPTNYQDQYYFYEPFVKDLQAPLFGPIFNLKFAYTEGRQ